MKLQGNHFDRILPFIGPRSPLVSEKTMMQQVIVSVTKINYKTTLTITAHALAQQLNMTSQPRFQSRCNCVVFPEHIFNSFILIFYRGNMTRPVRHGQRFYGSLLP